jgi:hypothetical protein
MNRSRQPGRRKRSGRPGLSPGNRPWWATALAIFCAATVVFLIARDLMIPEVRDVEVWFGLEIHGPLAWLTAPLHWAIFAIGAWGYWRVRPWIWPWPSVYAFTVAFGHLVWNLTSPSGGGWLDGLLQVLLFSIPAIALLFARPPVATGRLEHRSGPCSTA